MNQLVCIDSQIFGWVFRDDKPTEGNLSNYTDAQKLMAALEEGGYKILIPNIVLAEVACPLKESGQNRFFDSLPKGIVFCDFTQRSARILSRILHRQYFEKGKSYSGEHNIVKAKMKYDSMILACAVDMGASCFYTVDEDFRKYDLGYIPILGLKDTPPGHSSGPLFTT